MTPVLGKSSKQDWIHSHEMTLLLQSVYHKQNYILPISRKSVKRASDYIYSSFTYDDPCKNIIFRCQMSQDFCSFLLYCHVDRRRKLSKR